jgi:hypothetical protein
MDVMVFEDIQDYCNTHPVTVDEFINMAKRCIFRSGEVSKQGTFVMYFRDGPKVYPWRSIHSLLMNCNVALVKPTNGANVCNWNNVKFLLNR